MTATGMKDLVALSRRYGGDPAWVLAGGGNTSFKDGKTLWVKASGSALGSIDEGGFCAMDRGKLDAIWLKSYPEGPAAREAAALADLMAARLPGEEKRPSVETLMHGFFPQAFVVHTHPGLVNGVTCGRAGLAMFRELFAEEAAWVPFVDPGYTLAMTIKNAVEDFRARKGRTPALLFMQNHGLLVAGENPEEIDRLSLLVMSRLEARLRRRPDRSPVSVPLSDLASSLAGLAGLAPKGSLVLHRADPDILAFAESQAGFAPLSSAFSPDHIVYAGHEFLRADGAGGLEAAWKDYRARNGADPRIALVAGVGAFAVAANRKATETALSLFLDAAGVAVYAESFGGALHMKAEKIEFIRNWEVESYRAKLNVGA